jgi:5-methylcytosine-specific restriction endonuclease McrA
VAEAHQPPYLDDLVALTAALVAREEAAANEAASRMHWTPSPVVPRLEPSIRVIAQVYERDHYQCRYCGQRVILTAVLRMLSRRYPDLIPYTSNWTAGKTHPVFASLSATLDHVEPVATGGAGLDPANLTCACWSCNRRKGDLALADLGWTLRDAHDDRWRGLADWYVPLWQALGAPALGDYDREWMRAVAAATPQRG